MRSLNRASHETDLLEEERDRIRRHLKRVLACHSFAHSQRCQSFLRYIVEETLAGRAAQIKERNIGVDVFGKSQDFDPQAESVVRVGAGEVRKRLLQAYQADFGDGVRIELPIGSYCPKFKIEDTARRAQKRAPSAPAPPAPSGLPWLAHRRRMLYGLAALLSAGMALFLLSAAMRPRQPVDLLWQSFAGYKQPVLLALPAPLVLEMKHPGLLSSKSNAQEIPVDELNQSTGSYTGIGAGWGAARFAEQLASRHQQFIIRFGRDVSFPDLNQSPAILLGGYSSALGMQMTRNLRYRLISEESQSSIVDSRAGGKMWTVPKNRPSPEIQEGYALITMLRNTESGYPILVVAGLNAADTLAGAEFVTGNECFRSFANAAPKNWPQKNFQIVLHESIYQGSPSQPAIVAWYVW